MKLQTGQFLKSTAALNGTTFESVVVFLAEYNAGGAVGFIVNRPFGRSLNQLEEFKHSSSFPLYEGGPVDREHLFLLHRRPDLIAEGLPVVNGIYNGGLFAAAVRAINNKTLGANDIKIFVGYCGWDAGDLEAELQEGSWVIVTESPESVFAGQE